MRTTVIVDDSAANLKIYSKFLGAVHPDMQVRTFQTPQEALSWLQQNEVDLIITDYKMPQMSGAIFTRHVRALPQCVDVPILVITAYADRDFRITALEAGASDFLLTPIDQAEFEPRVRNLLRLNDHQREARLRAKTLERELEKSEYLRDQIVRNSRAQLAQVIDSVPAMICATDLVGRQIFVNAYQTRIVGEDWRRQTDPRDLDALLAQGKSLSFEEEIFDKSGVARAFYTTKTALHDVGGVAIGLLITSVEITERKRAESRLLFQAEHDQLTALPNRHYLNQWLVREVDGGSVPKRPFALYYIDLDRFKFVNDGLGHHFGDRLLQAVSQRLQQAVRHGDVVARLGGDEFAILQLDVNSFGEASPFAERINQLLQEPFVIEGREIATSASIGVTIYPWDGASAQELLQNADLAMYRVKAHGRNGARPFTPDMLTAAHESMRVRSLLRGALDRDEFVLHYQPQVDLDTGLVIGAEALLRWRSEAGAVLGPEAFLQIAAESDIMRQLDEWVLRNACLQGVEWARTLESPIRVSVNLSAQSFRDRHFSDLVLDISREAGLKLSLLELELTEDVLLEQDDVFYKEMIRLRSHGVRLAIDDFGTGYSSMARLSGLAVDTLKIDRSFILGLGLENNISVVRGIASLGKALNADVLAEGVETAEELEQLRGAGCNLAQGYLFGCPVEAAELAIAVRHATGIRPSAVPLIADDKRSV